MLEWVQLAFVAAHATVYGLSETRCGDVDFPTECTHGAITASGDKFNPNNVTAAIPMPRNWRVRPKHVWMRVKGYTSCVRVKLNDKMNARFIGQRGFDLTPAAVKALTGEWPEKWWSGKVELCEGAR